MAINLKALAKAITATDKIITPAVSEWLTLHGDDALDEAVAEKIKQLLTTTPRYRGKSFSSSSAGSCIRAQVYGYLDAPGEAVDQQLANIYIDGKWRHLRWQAMLLSIGILTDIEYSLPWPAKRSVGTMDGLGVVPDTHPNVAWRGQEFGWELKGVSTFQYSSVSKGEPMEAHLNQVARYFLSSGLELFSIVYEDKTTQAFHEWVVQRDSADMKARIQESAYELDHLNEAVDTRTLPQRLPECASLRGETFRSCSYGGDSYGPCAKFNMWPKGDTFDKKRRSR